MKRELISEAVTLRLVDVRKRVETLDPHHYGELSKFVSGVKDGLLEYSPPAVPEAWLETNGDCLGSLRALSLGKSVSAHEGPQPPVESFLQELRKAALECRPFFDLLGERYRYPLNFSVPAEEAIREFILMRLMVSFRGRIEKGSIAAVDANDLLLLLNLVAVHATTTTDLRFLDALNYYYELLPAAWHPNTNHAWLLVCYLGLYTRALRLWR